MPSSAELVNVLRRRLLPFLKRLPAPIRQRIIRQPQHAFPRGRYLAIVDDVPVDHGGRTAAILARARMFERRGLTLDLVCCRPETPPKVAEKQLRRAGRLPLASTITDIHDWGPKGTSSSDWRAATIRDCLDGMMVTAMGKSTVFMMVEAPNCHRYVREWSHPRAVPVYVIHSAHCETIGDPSTVYRTHRDTMASGAPMVFLTEAQRAEARRHFGPGDNWYVIGNALPDLPARGGTPTRTSDVVVVSRLVEHKRIDHIIRAFDRVAGRHPEVRLRIFGTGEDVAAIEAVAAAQRHHAQIVFEGYTEDAASVYRAAGCTVLASRHEGFGLPLVEAMTQGCPVIAYDTPYGAAEVIRDGVNGFLVPDGDLAGLATRLDQVLSDNRLRRRLSRRSPETVRRYSQVSTADAWAAMFTELQAAPDQRTRVDAAAASAPLRTSAQDDDEGVHKTPDSD